MTTIKPQAKPAKTPPVLSDIDLITQKLQTAQQRHQLILDAQRQRLARSHNTKLLLNRRNLEDETQHICKSVQIFDRLIQDKLRVQRYKDTELDNLKERKIKHQTDRLQK